MVAEMRNKKNEVGKDYEGLVLKAEFAFRHHLIYNTLSRNAEPLKEYPQEPPADWVEHAGQALDQETATTRRRQSESSHPPVLSHVTRQLLRSGRRP